MQKRTDLQPVPGTSARQGAEGKEFLFTQNDFERVRRLIYDRAGIALGAALIALSLRRGPIRERYGDWSRLIV